MENIKNNLFELSVGADGIAILTINQTDNPTNLFSTEFINAYLKTAREAIADDSIVGVIITSGQSMFMPGADLRELGKMEGDASKLLAGNLDMHRGLREVETGEKPFVAAINGTAMGGGLELCLSCHYRVALNHPKTKLGFPESKVGLLPGGGGTAKAPYLLGIQNALTYILQGREVNVEKALKDGLIDAVADTQEELIAKAKEWIAQNPDPVQPWDNKKHKIPGGGLWSPNGFQTLAGATGNVSKMTHGNYPAQEYILKVVHDSLQVPIDRALEIEARYFTKLVQSPEAKNMIRTGFLGMQAAKKGKGRPKGVPPFKVQKLGVLGAGMMGAGIAYVAAKAGMEVVLKDVSVESAEKGKAYSNRVLEKAIQKGRSTPEKAEALLSRISPTADPSAVKGCDLVIEAVFETPNLKDKVTKETEAVLPNDKVYASNTSTIPISLLAKSSSRPEQFIGIHFFSPVERMPLVEIIVGEKTSQETVAAAIDFTVAIGKVPVVVNDSRGFFTSRCFSTFCSEGVFLMQEGVPAAMVENIAKQQGMPVGPLAVIDELTLTIGMNIYESDPSPNKPPHLTRMYEIQKDMVENHGRKGKKWGAGFYDYPEGEKKRLWPRLKEKFGANPDAIDREIVAKRIMHRQALESFRCLDEGVLQNALDGDLGSVLGWGFPIYTGGALSYIDYVGMEQFIADCDAFAQELGPRWEVPQSLRDLAASGCSVHEFQAAK